MNSKYIQDNIRKDLNSWHFIARIGSFLNIESDITEEDIENLSTPNKNGWYPINLSKNYDTYVFIEKIMGEKLIDEIKSNSVWNNAESSQTKYGQELLNLLIEKGLNLKYSKLYSLAPTYQERLRLSHYILQSISPSKVRPNLNYNKFIHPIDLAIQSSNAFFIEAVINNDNWSKYFNDFILNNTKIIIGDSFLIKDQAYKCYQLIYQKTNIKLDISNNKNIVISNSQEKPIELLEGY